MGYSSICLIFKLKVGRAHRILCLKAGTPQKRKAENAPFNQVYLRTAAIEK